MLKIRLKHNNNEDLTAGYHIMSQTFMRYVRVVFLDGGMSAYAQVVTATFSISNKFFWFFVPKHLPDIYLCMK